MPALGPRETEPDAWLGWLKEALLLLQRRPAAMAVWLTACLLPLLVAQQASWVPLRAASILLLMPLALMVFIRFAWCADYGIPAKFSDLMPTNHDCGVAVGIGAVMLVMFSAFDSVLGSLGLGFEQLVTELGLYRDTLADGSQAAPPLAHLLLGPVLVAGLVLGAAFAVCGVLLLAFGQWFALPMLVLHQSPLAPSMVMSAQAYPMNPVSMVGLAGVLLIGVGLVLVSLGWLALLMAPFLGALLYTSYRDVFLGRDVNQTVRVRAQDSSSSQRENAVSSSLPTPCSRSVIRTTASGDSL